VKVGDQITRAGTRAVRNAFDWEARLLDLRVGESLPLVVRRGARDVSISLTVADAPEVSAPKVTVLSELQLVTLTDVMRQERAIGVSNGALVYKVSERISDQIGLQSGDVIVQVGRARVASAEAASNAIEREGQRGPVVLVFERGRQLLQTSFSLR
jgi:serine protease Do